ncbi:MAG TPA: hypothetical protein DC064_23495 [Cyanobacteria bacterium UBA9273]|nr:hypothetical protein [Cyanobacteria bacterium UBA9273]
MQFLKLTIPLIASILFLGCIAKSPKPPVALVQIKETPTPDTVTLQAAINELQILQIKLADGTNYKTYAHLLKNTVPVIENAKGDAKVLAAVESAFKGHQLALEFWQCDRLNGYQELHQCRGKALSAIFAKYPDMKAEATAAIQGTDLSTLSAKLDKDQVLQTIWEKTTADMEAARRTISLNTSRK